MQTQLVDVYSIVALLIMIIVFLYWIKYFSSGRRAPITTRTHRPDPTGKGGIAAARGYDESFSSGLGTKSSFFPVTKSDREDRESAYVDYAERKSKESKSN